MLARLTLEYRPISWFKKYARNPRKNDAVIEQIRASIREYGFAVPMLCKSDGSVIDGDLRLKGAIAENLEEIPVVICDGWTDGQIKAFRIMVNRSVSWAEWDDELLAAEFMDLKNLDIDLSLTGFDMPELDRIMNVGGAAAGEDDVPETPVNPVTRAGDCWLLSAAEGTGGHRVKCGDSTQIGDIEHLMNGEKADMVFMDAPYGVNCGVANHNPRAKRWDKIQNDDLGKGELRDFLRECFHNLLVVCVEACPVYAWSAPMAPGYEMLLALQEAGLHIQSQIVWYKNTIVLGQADYQWRHELCWYGWTPGKNHFWEGGRDKATVWEISKDANSSYQHPAQKPVALSERAIGNSCRIDGRVLDLFGGSGSTLIGCEKTGRNARLMEITPVYTDVIVNRWRKFTGREATLECDGRTFADVRAERRPEAVAA